MAENEGSGDGGTKKAVYAAFAANLAITISKFIAGFYHG